MAALKRLCKPSQARLQRELLAEEEKAMAKKGGKSAKAAAEARRKRDAMRVKSSSQFKTGALLRALFHSLLRVSALLFHSFSAQFPVA